MYRVHVRNTILLVEDDPASRKLVKAVLNFRGYRIVEIDTVKEARQYLHKNIPSLMLLDIRLKDGSGLELGKEVRLKPEFENMPIIAITAQALAGDKEEILASGIDYYLAKPISTQQLRKLVDKLTQPETL